MISKYRELFNAQFTEKKYQAFKDDITSDFNYMPTFRLGETPFFISNELKAQLIQGCNEVIAFIQKEDFKLLTD